MGTGNGKPAALSRFRIGDQLPGSSTSWSGLNNVSASDDSRAVTGTMTANNAYSNYIFFHNFNFTLTPGVTPVGIEVFFERNDGVGENPKTIPCGL
jgi:hypothetical protein